MSGHCITSICKRFIGQPVIALVLYSILIPGPLKGQEDCRVDTIPPFCFVKDYAIPGNPETNSGIIFFPRVAVDMCSDLEMNTFFHLGSGKIMKEGDALGCGMHEFQNVVSDSSGNVSICKFLVEIRCSPQAEIQQKEPVHYAELSDTDQYPLGSLTRVWLSRDNGAASISEDTGNPMSKAYGMYRFSANRGTLSQYFSSEGEPFRSYFAGLKPGTQAFDLMWELIAKEHAETFETSQHQFILRTRYMPLVRKIKHDLDLDINRFSSVIKDAIWATAVEHGPENNLLIKALKQHHPENLNEEELLELLYQERAKWLNEQLYPWSKTHREWVAKCQGKLKQEKKMASSRLSRLASAINSKPYSSSTFRNK